MTIYHICALHHLVERKFLSSYDAAEFPWRVGREMCPSFHSLSFSMRRTSNLWCLLVSSDHLLQRPGGQRAGFILCKCAIARSIGWKWCRWSAESIWESVSRSNKTVTLSQKLFSKSPFIFSCQKFMWEKRQSTNELHWIWNICVCFQFPYH